MNESKQRKIGVLLSYALIVLNTLIQLLYTPFLIRMLGQSEYGLYSLVASIIGSLTVLDLGFGNAIVVFTSKLRSQEKYDEVKKLHGMFKIIFWFLGAVAALIGIVLFLNVDNLFANQMTNVELEKMRIMMLVLSFNLAVTFPFNIYSSIISAYERFTFQKVLSIINTILKPILMIPLLFLGYKSISMCIVITIVNIGIMLSNYLYCRKILDVHVRYSGFDVNMFKLIFGYSFWIFLGVIVDKVNWSVDEFILGAVSGTVAVSIYAVAAQINTLFLNLSTAISGVFLPKMSKIAAKGHDMEVFSNEFIKVGRLQYYVMFLIASGFVIFGKRFISIWAGESFGEAYYVALILVLPLIIPLIQNLGLSIMQAMNKYKFKSISTAVMTIFNLIISIILAKRYGAIGSAIGTAISLIVCNIVLINIYYSRVIKLDVFKFWKNIVYMTIKFMIPLLVTVILMLLTNVSNSYIYILVFGSFYTIVFMLFSYFIVMNDYEKSLVIKLFNKFRRV